MVPTFKERGTFAKLYTIVGCAHSGRATIDDIEDLIRSVEEAKSPSFTFIRVDNRGRSQVVACSRKLIRGRVDLCVALGLIEPSGSLTKVGQAAVQLSRFPSVVSKQIVAYLRDRSFDVDKNLRPWLVGGAFSLPTAKAVYDHYSPELPLAGFRLLLNVLVECGALTAIQSRVYLAS